MSLERLASGESFVLPVIVADAVFAELPAKIDFLVVNDGREIEQADIEILDEAAGLQDTVKGTF